MRALAEEIGRKDKMIEMCNRQVVIETRIGKELEECVERIKRNLKKYSGQMGGLDQLIL